MSSIFALIAILLTASSTQAATYYIAPNGSDANSGISPSTPWASLAKVQGYLNSNVGSIPRGTAFLFARGGSWRGGLTLPPGLNGAPGEPIIFGNYGDGAIPLFDGGGSTPACFYARGTGRGRTPLWSYVTIDGFECRDTTEYGVLFYQNQGGSAGMPAIVVENMNIHDTGPGAFRGANHSNSCGSHPCDDGHYRNQLMFVDENDRADGVRFLNNQVDHCGGHNCIQVQLDTGSPLIMGNTCSHWVHNCIDVKQSIGVMVRGNIVDGASSPGAAYYYENLPPSPTRNGSITWIDNLAYDAPNGIECEGDPSLGTVSCRAYNNTLYLPREGSAIASACKGGVAWDVRGNILDTTDPIFVCDTANSNACGEIVIWDHNDDGASQGDVHTAVVGPHDLIGVNPRYVNPAAHDFRLRSNSPLLRDHPIGMLTERRGITID